MNSKEIKKKYKGIKFIDTYNKGEVSVVITIHGNYVLYNDSEFAVGNYEPYAYSHGNIYMLDPDSFDVEHQEFTAYRVLNLTNGRVVDSFGYLNEPYEKRGCVVCGNRQNIDSIYTKDLLFLCNVHNPEGYYINKVVTDGSDVTIVYGTNLLVARCKLPTA